MVSIDHVYQKVLAISNKEQRGYITPQEFNLFADQAQKEIFEQYFYDLNQFKRIPGNQSEYSDVVGNLKEKISNFEIYDLAVNVIGTTGDVNLNIDAPDLYRLGMVRVNYQGVDPGSVAEEMEIRDLYIYGTSALGRWTKTRPAYIKRGSGIKIYPYPSVDTNIDSVFISYMRKPLKPTWGYLISQNSNTALFNPGASVNFELHPSEESELVYKILKLAGISMVRDDIMRAGQGLESMQIQQEKQ